MFSDGCAAQYKNYKNFLNFSDHKSDFWSFFTAIHGKSPSDGIGGVVKEKVANERLSRRRNTPILNAKDAFRWCNENTSGIDMFYAPPNEVVLARDDLQKRFEKGSFVPDTTNFYFFSNAVGSISYKRILKDCHFFGI